MNKSKLSPGGGGSQLSPKVGSNVAQAVYAAGTAYQLTNSAALLNLGTTPTSIVLSQPGTYLIFARAHVDYTGATFAAVRTVAIKLRRINNTAADLTNGATSALTDILTAITSTLGNIVIPPVVYTTDKDNDNIQLFGSVDTVPTAGSIDVSEAEIVAIKLS